MTASYLSGTRGTLRCAIHLCDGCAQRMPLRALLVRMRNFHDGCLVEGFTDDLQTHWQSCGQARGDADAWQASERCGNGEQVVPVHGERVLGLCAERERDGGRGRSNHCVEPREYGVEILLDERAYFLRLQVIGVVVARRQRIRAENDPALHLAAEALPARGLVDVPQPRAGGSNREAVLDTVVAGEVCAALRWRNQVVGRQTVACMWQGDLVELGAK